MSSIKKCKQLFLLTIQTAHNAAIDSFSCIKQCFTILTLSN